MTAPVTVNPRRWVVVWPPPLVRVRAETLARCARLLAATR